MIYRTLSQNLNDATQLITQHKIVATYLFSYFAHRDFQNYLSKLLVSMSQRKGRMYLYSATPRSANKY